MLRAESALSLKQFALLQKVWPKLLGELAVDSCEELWTRKVPDEMQGSGCLWNIDKSMVIISSTRHAAATQALLFRPHSSL